MKEFLDLYLNNKLQMVEEKHTSRLSGLTFTSLPPEVGSECYSAIQLHFPSPFNFPSPNNLSHTSSSSFKLSPLPPLSINDFAYNFTQKTEAIYGNCSHYFPST
jgi:hypothetical protein